MMATPQQNLPTTEEQGAVASTSSGDRGTQPASGIGQANDTEEQPPPLPQRQPTHQTQPQVLPQAFFGPQQPLYAPYNGQAANQQFTYVNPVRQLPKQSSAYIATRLGLTALASVWGIIIIALTSILLSEGGAAASVSIYAYAIVAASIIWNTAELITYCARLRKEVQRGIHPGAHVGLHLIFWLAGIFALLLSTSVYISVAYDLERCAHRDDDDSYYGYSYSYCSDYKPFDYWRWNVLPVIRALLAIFALFTINHFALFVLACIETHKRNISTAFVVPANAIPPQAMYYPQQAVPAQVMYPPQAAGAQSMQPMQFYPYPVMVQQSQPSNLSDGESQTPVSNEKQPAQSHQTAAGYYAPPGAL
ncbi:hypothetical protein F4808DRAFT_114241 [Astrocystis sublimbata]|nr:hypothetical protein F4808DRAFT_114241 [Astrocystis sublimbata]